MKQTKLSRYFLSRGFLIKKLFCVELGSIWLLFPVSIIVFFHNATVLQKYRTVQRIILDLLILRQQIATILMGE